MSGVAGLYNVPSDDAELKQWATLHQMHHRDINAAIYRLTKIALPEYILDPIDVNDTGNWEDNHQNMHQLQDFLLGITGYDLSEVDWKNKNITAGWIYLNALEHKQAADILEIG